MIWDLHVAPQFFGCTVSADGRKGLVPKPVAGEHLSFLRGDGTWQSVSGAGLGDVSGPASATDNAVARFNGTGGKNVQNSGVIIDDSNNVTGVANITITGALSIPNGNTVAWGDASVYVQGNAAAETLSLIVNSTTALSISATTAAITRDLVSLSGVVRMDHATPYFYPDTTTKSITLYGSSSATVGLILYGNAHATNPTLAHFLGYNVKTDGNLTVSGTGTHTFAGVVRGTQMYGLCAAAGTSGYFTDATNSTFYITHPSAGVMSFKNGAGTTWLSETSTNVTLAGNLTVSGTGTSSFSGNISLLKKASAANTLLTIDRYNNAVAGGWELYTNTTNDWFVGLRGTADSDFHIYSYGAAADSLIITRATGAVTFGSSITTAAPTGGAGAWKLGIANAVSPTAPNRTVTIEVGGTLYYLHAKTTNN
jgi:hypothetical protein